MTASATGYEDGNEPSVTVTAGSTASVDFELDETTPPEINIVKPAVSGEYVSGDAAAPVFIKAYITDDSGVSWAEFYVDGQDKGPMYQEGDYWRYDWNTSGTSVGAHTIKVEAADNSANENVGDAERSVFANPTVYLTDISFLNGHTLWQRQGSDEEITTPQWTPPSYTQPFAYTIGSQMTVDVGMDSDDVTGTVYYAYNVGGTWKNSDEVTKGTA